MCSGNMNCGLCKNHSDRVSEIIAIIPPIEHHTCAKGFIQEDEVDCPCFEMYEGYILKNGNGRKRREVR